jgi:membrane-associated HD superfamily phosphohydrolase
MSIDVLSSVALLLAAAIAVFLTVRWVFNRLRGAKAMWLVIALLWIAAIAGILVVDVNIPLAESRYSLGRALGPSLAVLAMFLRFAAIASIVFGQPKLRITLSQAPTAPAGRSR